MNAPGEEPFIPADLAEAQLTPETEDGFLLRFLTEQSFNFKLYIQHRGLSWAKGSTIQRVIV